MTGDSGRPDELATERAELAAETRAEVEFAATERLVFFTDAVLAIALTLLAIDLPEPEGSSSRELLRSLGDHASAYLAFGISFLVISAHWRSHHQTFRYVGHSTPRLVQLNTAWLLLTVITPWSTRLVAGGEGSNLVRFVAYAGTQGLQFGLFVIIVQTVLRDRLLRPAADTTVLLRVRRRSLLFTVTFLGSIACYPWLQNLTYAVWFVVPLVVNVVRRVMERLRRTPGSDGPSAAGGAGPSRG